jgi:hypothetical protein
MEPKLLNIYHKYYQEAERSSIDLIELIKKVGIDKLENAISKLERLNIKAVTTDKIITRCQRVDFPPDDKLIEAGLPNKEGLQKNSSSIWQASKRR